ncbi:Mu-like prophage protein gp46 [Pseudoxanthobacter soli DSM 19599]|uniref:Mu-like prophage protein gp46 n=1 Tax=Pseudoxanthobacter soli DSM 19599 TaxID=1123029 RepID=A0A1M7ZLY2_9HYPH|nr:phage GP46 family protein [Pseudoxanthobacter soli]SHO65809.1 Mu-like prophage protein gp46 [Pseudoxanthobacter soli DSM 19599]
MDVRVRIDEGCSAPLSILWDSVWDSATGLADWAVGPSPLDRVAPILVVDGLMLRGAAFAAADIDVQLSPTPYPPADPAPVPSNPGGLRADAAIETAVILALFTDRRVPEGHPLATGIDDRRGWWGDGVDVRADLGEGEIGSLLWLLERQTVSDEMAAWARTLAAEALAPLISQGVAVRVDTSAEARPAERTILLAVTLYGRDGSKVYDRRFELLWQQVR